MDTASINDGGRGREGHARLGLSTVLRAATQAHRALIAGRAPENRAEDDVVAADIPAGRPR